ncbi:MAG: relaxase domain-containing protein [Sphingobium sp.]
MLATRVNDINRKSYQPFLMKLAEFKAAFDGFGDRVVAAQGAGLASLAKQLEAVRVEASAPRTQYSLVLVDDRMLSLKFLSACGLLTGLLAILLFLFTAAYLPALGVPVARRLLPDTALICRIIDERYNVTDCRIPQDAATVPTRQEGRPMINLAAVSSAASAGEYYSHDNYYTSSELTGASQWVGEGTERLELEGQVDEQILTRLLSGELPDGSVICAPNGEHCPGLDMTFSASKSVSLLALLGGEMIGSPTRSAIP